MTTREVISLPFRVIRYRFTCGELNFHRNKLNCKDIMSLIIGTDTNLDVSVGIKDAMNRPCNCFLDIF